MKKLLPVFALVLMLASCSKQANDNLRKDEVNKVSVLKAPVVMNEVQLSYEIGKENAAKVFAPLYAKENEAVAKGKPKAAVTVVAWLNDITLTHAAGVLTTTISEHAQWAGITRFESTSNNDGATVPTGCNWNFNTAPGAGITRSCNGNGTGFYRSFTSDFDYTVHISEWLFL